MGSARPPAGRAGLFTRVLACDDLSPAFKPVLAGLRSLRSLGTREVVLVHALGLENLEELRDSFRAAVEPHLAAKRVAIEELEAGLALQPASVEGHYNLGGVHLECGRHDDAIGCFKRALRLQPGHPEALYSIGLCYLRKGMYDRALHHLEEAARATPPAPRLLYAIGLCYNGLELPRQAARVLTSLVASVPDHARAHHLLGVCFDKLGDRDRAEQAYRRADLCLSAARARRGGARLVREDWRGRRRAGAGPRSPGGTMPLPLAERMDRLKSAGTRAFIPFLTAGYPDPETFAVLLRCTRSADFVEVGLPFSDPVADGPSICHASDVALAHGMHAGWMFDVSGEYRTAFLLLAVAFFPALPALLAAKKPVKKQFCRIGIDFIGRDWTYCQC